MDWLFSWYYRIKRWFVKRGLIKALEAEKIEAEFAEEFLKILLNLMSLSFIIDKEYREYIKGFTGIIQFRSKDNEIRVLAIFNNGNLIAKELKPNEVLVKKPNVSVVFKDPIALINFLLPKGGKRDILRSLLNNEVILKGNLNYIYRFGFLANHLQLEQNFPIPKFLYKN
ncbi:MAG: hypothetical protein AB1630_07480 [bacterium]